MSTYTWTVLLYNSFYLQSNIKNYLKWNVLFHTAFATRYTQVLVIYDI